VVKESNLVTCVVLKRECCRIINLNVSLVILSDHFYSIVAINKTEVLSCVLVGVLRMKWKLNQPMKLQFLVFMQFW